MVHISKAFKSIIVVLGTGSLLLGLSGHSARLSFYKKKSDSKLAESKDLIVDKSTCASGETEIDACLNLMGLKHSHRIYQSKASWYGESFQGKPTANMEIFDKNLISAAHKFLPLNTYLLVTNLENGLKTIVRINDRGPFVEDRDLDLSEAAAKVIGSYSRGVVPVEYEILERRA